MLFLKFTLLDDREVLIDVHLIQTLVERKTGEGINITLENDYHEVKETIEDFSRMIKALNGDDSFSNN